MSFLQKPIFWVGLGALGIVAWFATSPQEGPKLTTKRATKRTSKAKGQETYLREDFERTFAPVRSDLKNVFVPIVAKSGVGGADSLANAIPPDFAGGDPGWVYTGNAEIDGVPSALLEHRPTGEGVFLQAGKRWRNAIVLRIEANAVVMKGPSGTKTFGLVDEERPSNLASRGGFQPIRVNPGPEIRGAIGRQPNNGAAYFPDGPAPTITMSPDDEDPVPIIVAPPEENQ